VLSESLVSVYEYHNLKYSDNLLIEDKKYVNKVRKKDPLFSLGKKFRDVFSQIQSNKDECSKDVLSNHRELSHEEKKKVILKFKKRMKKR